MNTSIQQRLSILYKNPIQNFPIQLPQQNQKPFYVVSRAHVTRTVYLQDLLLYAVSGGVMWVATSLVLGIILQVFVDMQQPGIASDDVVTAVLSNQALPQTEATL